MRLIAVFDRRDMSLVAATLSALGTGVWEIAGLPEYPEGVLLVLAVDNSSTYNAEAADYVSQVTGAGV